MNSIRAQNAIIDLLKGVVDDVEMTSHVVHSTADPTVIDSDSENEIRGGAPAIEAVENVFLTGGAPTSVSERNEFAELAEKIASQENIAGGNADHEDSEEEQEEKKESNNSEEANNEEASEESVSEKTVKENEEFEPDDMDGKEPIAVDDEGDKIEDKFDSDNDNEEEAEEEKSDELEMKGGANIQRVNMITADLKFPFILKSRRK